MLLVLSVSAFFGGCHKNVQNMREFTCFTCLKVLSSSFQLLNDTLVDFYSTHAAVCHQLVLVGEAH